MTNRNTSTCNWLVFTFFSQKGSVLVPNKPLCGQVCPTATRSIAFFRCKVDTMAFVQNSNCPTPVEDHNYSLFITDIQCNTLQWGEKERERENISGTIIMISKTQRILEGGERRKICGEWYGSTSALFVVRG